MPRPPTAGAALRALSIPLLLTVLACGDDGVASPNVCVEHSRTMSLVGRVVRPSGLEGDVRIVVHEDFSERCQPPIRGPVTSTPGEVIGNLVLSQGEAFFFDLLVTYVEDVPGLAVLMFLDVDGDGICDGDTDSGGQLSLAPGNYTDLEITLVRGQCPGIG